MMEMFCPCPSNVQTSVQRLKALLALEAMLDEELDKLEHQYSLYLVKLDWFHKEGLQDLCDVIVKCMEKTESLLRMYRPMLQDACAEKTELMESIAEIQWRSDENCDHVMELPLNSNPTQGQIISAGGLGDETLTRYT